MSQPKIAKSKDKKEIPKMKVMHVVSKDENSNATITSRQLNPKLKEAVGPDVQQVAEETGHRVPKTKDELSDEQRSVLKALDKLGGKDIESMPIAKHLGFDKTHKNAPRAPVRNAMEHLAKLHLVTRKKQGAKYSFSITDKGKQALSQPVHKDVKDKEGSAKPAPTSTVLERPANADKVCKCGVANPYIAVHCKACGALLADTVSNAALVAA